MNDTHCIRIFGPANSDLILAWLRNIDKVIDDESLKKLLKKHPSSVPHGHVGGTTDLAPHACNAAQIAIPHIGKYCFQSPCHVHRITANSSFLSIYKAFNVKTRNLQIYQSIGDYFLL